MPLLVRCPSCGKLLAAGAKRCKTQTGKGCGARLPSGKQIYYCQWLDEDGRNHQKKLGLMLRKDAKTKEADALHAVAKGQKPFERPKDKFTVKEFVSKEYRPWCEQYNRRPDQKEWYLKHIIREWGGLRLSKITEKSLDQFRWRMRKEGKLVTFNRVAQVLNHMFSVAIERGYLKERPVKVAGKKFKEKPKLRFLEAHEVARLVQAASPRLRPIIITALHTGLRRSEVLSLRVGYEVDLDRRLITVSETKNDEARSVPVNDTLGAVLDDLCRDLEFGDHLFTKANREPLRDVRTAFGGACKRAGLEGVTFHTLRHTFASHLAMSGVDLRTISSLMGHKSLTMTMRYAHLSARHERASVGSLDRALDSGSNESQFISCISADTQLMEGKTGKSTLDLTPVNKKREFG